MSILQFIQAGFSDEMEKISGQIEARVIPSIFTKIKEGMFKYPKGKLQNVKSALGKPFVKKPLGGKRYTPSRKIGL